MNNEPDYKDNLAFEPKMNYEDVFQWAVEKYGYIKFKRNDDVTVIQKVSPSYALITFIGGGTFMIENMEISKLKPEQMKQLILALE